MNMMESLIGALETEHLHATDHCFQEANKDCEVCKLILEAHAWKEPTFGPIAIVCDGGLVQSVNTDDERLIGKLDIVVIDYDIDSAEEVYAVPQVGEAGPTLLSEAQLFGVAVTPADGIDLPETWRRYMADEVTLDCAKINAEAEGYRVRIVSGMGTFPARWEWYTSEAVAFVDYEDEDAAWMAAYQDLVQ